jgi:ppGpp synthetase/RelA/SpoT-type nucleotidyltranferase
VDARAKSISSFAEKIARKNKYKDPLREMTDLCGVRVVTPLRANVEAVCAFIRENFVIDEANSLDTLSRLRPGEFGYRSVHYVVQCKPGRFTEVPGNLMTLKAEIQVRTILQHAWSEIGHDRLYKGGFIVPQAWEREAACIAALMENADESFARMVCGLEALRSDYGAYMTPEQMKYELELAGVILGHAPEDVALAERRARMALGHEQWEVAKETAQGVPKEIQTKGILYCLGTALCRLHGPNGQQPNPIEYARGMKLLNDVADADPADVASRLRLGEEETDQVLRLERYHDAFTADPSDPEALGSYVRERILAKGDAEFVSLVTSDLESALDKCRLQLDAGVDIPRVLYRMARFHLLLGQCFEAIDALAKAVRRTQPGSSLIATALEEADALGRAQPERNDIKAIVRFLAVARHVHAPSDASRQQIENLATPGVPPIEGPVAIVAGGCDPALQAEMQGYWDLVEVTFESYRGTVLSGGTRQGISGLVGQLGKASNGRIHTIGYLPKERPPDGSATEDDRFDELRRTANAAAFSALEPLQNWIDLLASKVDPASVRMIGINGGRIAAIEYRIAWALGAQVAVVEKSGREADLLEQEVLAGSFQGVLVVPKDPMTLRAFLHTGTPSPGLTDEEVVRLARLVHTRYLEQARHQNPDPTQRPWEHLPAGLQHSNVDQMAYMAQALAMASLEIVPDTDPRPAVDLAPGTEPNEGLAAMEHGRWNHERICDGWRSGPRNPAEKTSPYLVTWDKLADGVKGWDRGAVADWPQLLAELGRKIVERK